MPQINDFNANMFTDPTRPKRGKPTESGTMFDNKAGEQKENKRGYAYDPTYRAREFDAVYPTWNDAVEPTVWNKVSEAFAKGRKKLKADCPELKKQEHLRRYEPGFQSPLTADKMPITLRRPSMPVETPLFRLEAGFEDEKIARVMLDGLNWLRSHSMEWINLAAAPVTLIKDGDNWKETTGDILIGWKRDPDYSRRVRTVTLIISTNQTLADFRRMFFRLVFRAMTIEVEAAYGVGTVSSWLDGMENRQHVMAQDDTQSEMSLLEDRFASFIEVQQQGAVYAETEDFGPHLVAFMSIISGEMGATVTYAANFFRPAPMWGRKTQPQAA